MFSNVFPIISLIFLIIWPPNAISSEEQGDPEDGGTCSSHCHEDATDLVHGLIRELSSLKLVNLPLFVLAHTHTHHFVLQHFIKLLVLNAFFQSGCDGNTAKGGTLTPWQQGSQELLGAHIQHGPIYLVLDF